MVPQMSSPLCLEPVSWQKGIKVAVGIKFANQQTLQ